MATYYTDITAIRTTKWKDVSLDNVDATQMENAAKTAHDYINARLAKRYTVPFTSVPALVVEISDIFTVDNAKTYTGGHKRVTKGVWSEIVARAERWLDMLASGDMLLPGVTPTATAGGLWSSTEGEARVFNNDDVDNWGADPDQLSRIADERAD